MRTIHAHIPSASMPTSSADISDAAVTRATGKTWKDWFAFLDERGGKAMSHRDMARLLHDEKHIDSTWWCQMVAVTYEKKRGKRVTGQATGAGFQVGVSKTLQTTPAALWDFVTSTRGVALWLGDGTSLTLTPGAAYRTDDGTTGEIRTVQHGKRLRLTWKPKDTKTATTLQLTVIPRRSTHGTCLSFHHERLSGAKERQAMREHWQTVTSTIGSALA